MGGTKPVPHLPPTLFLPCPPPGDADPGDVGPSRGASDGGGDGGPPPAPSQGAPPVSQLVRLLWGEDTAELQMALGHVPHVAMYLSLQLDSETLQEEVGGPPVESVHTHTAFPQPRSPEQGSVCTVCTCGRQWLRR